MKQSILRQDVRVINVGLDLFYNTLREQNAAVAAVDWRPPAVEPAMLALLAGLDQNREQIAAANREAVERMQSAQPVLIDIRQAKDVIPGMTKHTLLHAGPPVAWPDMCGPMRAGVLVALKYEGLAENDQQAEALAASGKIAFAPCNDYGAVGPMTGITSYSMPLYVIENAVHKTYSYSTINEGMGKVLRFGANSAEVVDRLKWIECRLAPVMQQAIRLSGGLNLKVMIAQAVAMGDELHMRNASTAAMYARFLAPWLAQACPDNELLVKILRFLSVNNEQSFLNLAMAAGKATMLATHGIPHSTLVTCMARNGVEFGIKVSGLGDAWFTAPANKINGLYFSGFSQADANPDLGDSAVMETYGLGGFAMAAAPAIVRFLGSGSAEDAIAYTEEMYEITMAENRQFLIPGLNFRGTPTGIDLRKVVETGIEPIINTAISHREPGVGMIGAGMARAPREAFVKALYGFMQV